MASGSLQVTGNINSFNIVNFTAEIDAEGPQILQWLSPLEPRQRHQGVRTNRLDGVGDWVLETNEFKKWSNTEDGCVESVLFCYGNPGVGKTYLSSLVIDSLCDQAGGKDVAIVGLYCDFLAHQEQSVTNMLGAILKQLACREGIPEHIQKVFQKAKKELGGRGLRLPDLVELLKKAIALLPQLFICIDALDECTPNHRRGLLESLREIIRVSTNTRVFLTGRPHVDDEIVRCFNKVVRIHLSPTQSDIKSYLEARLDSDTDPSVMDGKLRADIMRVIPEKISEIFLLVSLSIDAILGEVTLHQRRKKLDEMTKGKSLSDAYAVTLSRMKAQHKSRSKLGMEVLMWISHSERPLHVDELCHALGVEEGSIDLNNENIPAIEALLACCMGLVTVEKSSHTVRLVHYTLREYLSCNPNLFLQPHAMIAEVCLTYLNFRHVRGFPTTLRSAPSTAPFVEYASCHWGTHAKRETTESVKSLALKLLDGYDKHIASKLMLLRGMGVWSAPFDQGGNPRGFTGLHGAAYLGCVEITATLLETNKWDVQATDFNGNTAIGWAARKGHEGVVRALLERNDVNLDIADTWYGRTPLLWAAENGHEGVVRMLLERNDANPDIADTLYGQTPLSLASGGGREGVVRMLLERGDVSHEAVDTEYGRTPLSWAAQNGHDRVVRMLLEQNDVNPNTVDTEYGRTPLSWAAKNRHEGVVRTLLEHNDVNPNTADAGSGQTPILWAAGNGHEEVVRILLERNDINPNTADTRYGRTPLLWAVRSGHWGVVRVLLQRNDVNPNIADTWHGQTPLTLATGNGDERVVGMLLRRRDIYPDMADIWYDRTPLSWAAETGHEGIVRALLERNDVGPSIVDSKYGRTPLSWAAANGHDGVVRKLLERNDANPNLADTEYNRTPLLWAAKNGHEEVVRMLLLRNDINPDTLDARYGRTPLLWAVVSGHERIVKMLLQRNDVVPDTSDTRGRTPLSWAAKNGDWRMVKILLEQNAVNPNTADSEYGRTPLSWAAENGHEGVVRALLRRSDANPNTADAKHGRTPLLWAAKNGHKRVVRALLGWSDINPNTAETKYGRTLLLRAAKKRRAGVMNALLHRRGINPNTADTKYGRTPLSWAAGNGHVKVVKNLLLRNDVNPNLADTGSGRTPLLWASKNGHQRVVKLLQERVD